jgi:hypothetical protein
MAVGSIGRRNTSIKSRSARVSKPKVSHDRSLSCRATRLNWERAPPAVPQLLLGHRVEPSTISSTHRPSTPSLASDITCCVPHTVNSAFDGSRINRHKIDAGVTFFGRLLLRYALRLGVESVVLPFQLKFAMDGSAPNTGDPAIKSAEGLHYSHSIGKSLFVSNCVVGLRGLELPTKRLSAALACAAGAPQSWSIGRLRHVGPPRTLPRDQISFQPIAPILHAHRRLWKTDRWIFQPTPQTHVGDGISRANLRTGEESAGWIIGGVRVFSTAQALMWGAG